MIEVKTNCHPDLVYSNVEAVKEDANKIDATPCKIIHIDDWDGVETFIGFGLIKEGELL